MNRIATRLLILSAAFLTRTWAADPAPVHVYLGNLHSHTGYSDGSGTPEQAFIYARDVAKLDFLAVTEHNHLLGGAAATLPQREALYSGPAPSALRPTAARLTEDGKFVALYGQEFSTMSKGNHVNVFDVPGVIDVEAGDFAGLLKWMHAHPDSTGHTAVLQLNHPALGRPGKNGIGKVEFGRDDFQDDTGWVREMGGASSLVEILNGEPPLNKPDTRAPQIMEFYYQLFLQLGFHVAPTGDQDNHHGHWGDATEARTGIIAPALTTRDLLDAMRDRHVYATEDRNLRAIFRVNGRLCGDILSPPPGPLEVRFDLEDADEPAAGYTIEAFQGKIGGSFASIVKTVKIAGDTKTGAIDGLTLGGSGEYVYFRVTQAGAVPDRLWTAPVWAEGEVASPRR
jgi:hypothetical protein